MGASTGFTQVPLCPGCGCGSVMQCTCIVYLRWLLFEWILRCEEVRQPPSGCACCRWPQEMCFPWSGSGACLYLAAGRPCTPHMLELCGLSRWQKKVLRGWRTFLGGLVDGPSRVTDEKQGDCWPIWWGSLLVKAAGRGDVSAPGLLPDHLVF